MSYSGKVQNGVVVLDNGMTLAEGTVVRVETAPNQANLRKGSPSSMLRLAGTLSDDEADAILKSAQECRRIDHALWTGRP